MKKLPLLAIAGAVAAIALSHPLPAKADGFAFSFNTGNVDLAYRDGYYDHHHHWHRWRNDREAREYHSRFAGRWHDADHDGVPDRLDAHPLNPHRD